MDNRSKGYIYAIISRFCGLGFPIFATFALVYYNQLTLAVLWFGSASVFSTILVILMGKAHEFKSFRKYWKWLLLANLLQSMSIVASFYALSILGPSLMGFLSHLTLLFVVFAGVLVLKERFNIYEILSGIVILIGVISISFGTGKLIITGIILIIIIATTIALWRLIIKTKLASIHPMVNVSYRAISATIFIFIFARIIGEFEFSVSKGLWFATVPSILSAVLNQYYTFKAYKYIGISKVALVSALSPILLAILSFFIFREVLNLNQWVGGLIIVLGVIGLVFAKKLTKKGLDIVNGN